MNVPLPEPRWTAEHGRSLTRIAGIALAAAPLFTHAVPATGDGQDVFEAESANLFAGVVTASNQPGYSGSSFADYPAATGANVKVQWQIERGDAGDADIDVRYANGSGASRPLELVVNGNTVELIARSSIGANIDRLSLPSEGSASTLGATTARQVVNRVIHWPVASMNDGDTVSGKTYDELWGARYVATTRIGSNTYALVTASWDNGVQIIDITDPASPAPVSSFDDGDTVSGKTFDTLGGTDEIVIARIGSNTYALVVGWRDHGVQIVDVTDPANPVPVASFADGDTVGGKTYDELRGATGITTAKIGSGTYALVVADDDDGVQIVDITDPANPVPVASFDDGDTVEGKTYDELEGPASITTARIGAGTYALVAASDDDGVQIVDITDPANPVPVASFDDGDTVGSGTYDELDDPRYITTARIGSSTYALVACFADNGVQIIDITDPANPVPAASFDEGDTAAGKTYRELKGAGSVTTARIGSRTYAAVVAHDDNGVQIVDISDPESPVPVASFEDGDTVGSRTYENLQGPANIGTVRIGSGTYFLVTAYFDNGVQIIGLKGPLTVDAGQDQAVDEEETVTLSGTVSDPEDDRLTVEWTHDSSLAIDLADDEALSTGFTAPAVTADTTVTFTLAVSDGTTSVSDTVAVTIRDNSPPTVDAGRDQAVREGRTVTLSGTASDPENDPLTYRWSHDSSLAIELGDDTVLSTSFTAPAITTDTTVAFTLAVSDGNTSVSDTVAVTISDNRPPVVEAGPDQAVDTRATVTLSGTAFDPDNDPLAYQWTHDSSLEIGLANATTLTTTLVAPAVTSDTTVTFTLAVSDGLASNFDTVSIAIDAGPVQALDSLTLSGVDIGAFDPETTGYAGVVASTVTTTTVTATPTDSGNEVTIADPDGRTAGTSRPVSLAEGTTKITVTVVGTDDEANGAYTVTVTRVPDTWGARRPEQDIALDAISRPTGIWGSMETLWIAAWGEYDIYAYDFAGSRVSDEDLTLTGGGYPKDMWSDGTTLWVADHFSGVQAHSLADGSRVPDEDFGDATSTAGNDAPNGLWSDGMTMRVADRVDGKIYAYALSDKARQTDAEFSLGGVETFKPFGLWSNGKTVFSASWHGGKVHAFRLADGRVLPAMDIDTGASGNTRPFGVWSVGETMWVVDDAAQKAFAYAVPGLGGAGGEEEAAEVVEVSIVADATPVSEGTAAAFTLIRTGDTADALTVAVSVSESGAMAAAVAPTEATFASGDSTAALAVATTNDAVVETSSTVTAALTPGIGYAVAADAGSAETVVEDDDAATFAVALSAEAVAEGASATLTVSVTNGVTFAVAQTVGIATSGTASASDYSLLVGGEALSAPVQLTLPAGTGETVATLSVTDDAETESEESVTLTASHGGTGIGAATATIPANDAPSTDATLKALALSGLDIGTFNAATTAYAVAAAELVAETTVTATPTDADATVTITDANGSKSGTTRDVALDYGSNTITVEVTAADGETTQTYTATVTRAYTLPTATIAAGTSPVTEGSDASFTVRLDKAAKDALTVAVSMTETGGMLSGTASSVAIAVGDTSATLNLGTVDDSVVEAASSVTVALGAGDGYTVGTADSATVSVADDDAATFAVAAAPGAIEEGDAATVTVSIANGVTFAAGQAVTLTASGTAAADDYTLSPTSLTLAAGDASVSATLTATDDEVEEPAETVTVAASLGGSTIGSATVTIAAGDAPLSDDATLSALTLSDIDIGAFDPATRDYTAEVGHDVEATSVTATPTRADASVTIVDGNGTTSGTRRDVALGYGANTITVTVTAADGETTATYTVTVTRRPPLTASVHDVPARHDGVSDVEFELRFSEEIALSYRTLRAGYKVQGGTLRWTRRIEPPGNVRWRIVVEPAGDGEVTALLPGNQTCGAAGAVCAADGRMLSNSPVARIPGPLTVPVVSIVADGTPVSEGRAAAFTLTRTGDATKVLTVAVTVAESGAMASGALPTEATFAAEAAAAALSVATTDDAVVEASSTVTAALTAGTGYAVSAEDGAAQVLVVDNDTATFALEASPSTIEEGDAATVTVSIANGVTFAADQAVTLTASGTAAAEDYTLSATSLTLPAGDDAVSATLAATDDEAEEPDETVTVSASHGGTAIGTATVTIAANDVPPSDDATLASLTLSDIDIGAFDPATTAYSAEVGNDVDSTTVTGTPNDADASVTISDADGSTAGTTRTTRLAEGANAISATVTAADGETTATYTVTVTRAAVETAAWGERLPDKDIDLSDADRPRGLGSDGETLWAADWDTSGVVAYALADGARREARDFGLGSFLVSALYTDGETLWAADYEGGVSAYRLSDGERLEASDLDAETMAEAGNGRPAGLWSDGATMWVADQSDRHVYAYRLSDGARESGKEFALVVGDVEYMTPFGLWSDGETVLATDWLQGTVRGYALAGGARQSGNDIGEVATANDYAAGLWSDGETLWVVDEYAKKAYAYAAPGLRKPAPRSAGLVSGLSSRALVVPGGTAAGLPVSIPDGALRDRIAAALGKAVADAVGVHELGALVVLDARAAGVTDLTGLEHAVNLEGLDLGHNPLNDLRPLWSLTALRRLNLDGARVDLRDLATLRGLTELSLRSNGLADVWALSSMNGLEVLDLAGNRVGDLAAVAALTDLRVLGVSGNRVAELWPLAGLERLCELHVGGNLIEDFSPLGERAGLRVFGVGDQHRGD